MSGMYQLPPIVPIDMVIELPTCMYRLPTIPTIVGAEGVSNEVIILLPIFD